jgi:hypothetical protein
MAKANSGGNRWYQLYWYVAPQTTLSPLLQREQAMNK